MAAFDRPIGLTSPLTFGPEVLRVQRRLGLLGVGVYDEATYEAVRRFQAERGLLTTGTVDEATWLALEATVRGGLVPTWWGTSEAVSEARRRLGLTERQDLEAGIRRFQSARGLPLTGLLDEALATALGE